MKVSDAITDFKKDGDQSLVTRGVTIAENAALAAGGDLLLTYVGRGVISAIQRITGKNLSELLKGPNKVDDVVEGAAEPKPLDVPAPVDPPSTVNIDNGVLIEHLVDGHGIGRGSKPSVKGAHNLDSFNKTIDEEASKYGLTRSDFIIGDPKPHPQIEGIYEVNYRIPSLETDYVNGGLKLKLNSEP
ncbi:hypothetical protein [Paenibacillus sp. DS2015]|uniref:hypothetical protein n=1 Tax=Paenibacillus sp. DS2015 TaxID=3373917 RepID=UPI003D2506F7